MRFIGSFVLCAWAISCFAPRVEAAEQEVIGAGTNREAFLKELRHIRDGYREGQRFFENLYVEGQLQPGDRDFKLTIKGGKRRWECELDGTSNAPVIVYRLVDGENHFLFQENELGIGSLENIDEKWYGGIARDFYRFQMPLVQEKETLAVDEFCDWILEHLDKDPNGPEAMKRLDAVYFITKSAEAITISIDVQQATPTGLGLNLELTVDPQRNYVMKSFVSDRKLGTIDPAGCRIRRFSAQHSELAPGVFFISTGNMEYVTGGRLAESDSGETSSLTASMVVKTVRFGDVELADSLFDVQSLPVSVGMTVYDQRTDPPVEFVYAKGPFEEAVLERAVNDLDEVPRRAGGLLHWTMVILSILVLVAACVFYARSRKAV